MRALRILLVAAVACLAPLSSGRASPEDPATTAELIGAVKAAYKDVSSVKADFTQVVRNATMGTEERTKGRIAIERPRKLRVEVGTPMQSAVISDGRTLWVYDVASKSVLETPEAVQGSEMGTLLEDLSRLDEVFVVDVVEDKPPKPSHTVRLTPRKPGNFKSILLTLSRQKYTLQELVLTDQLDNVTRMNFLNLRFNLDVADSEFVFVPPAGVQVIRSAGL